MKGVKMINGLGEPSKPPHSSLTTVAEFLETKYGNALDNAEKAQCHQAIIEFVSVLLEINQQQGIVHVDSE